MEDTATSGSLGGVAQDIPETDACPDTSLSREAAHARWQAGRPSVDHLPTGVVACDAAGMPPLLPRFKVGDRIVVDCRTRLLRNEPWLETIVGRVKSIDDDTGAVALVDEASDARLPVTRHVNFLCDLMAFKLAPPKGNPFDPALVARYLRSLQPPGKRGRPVGARNRDKHVIDAEKAAKIEAKRLRRIRRDLNAAPVVVTRKKGRKP